MKKIVSILLISALLLLPSATTEAAKSSTPSRNIENYEIYNDYEKWLSPYRDFRIEVFEELIMGLKRPARERKFVIRTARILIHPFY